VPVPRLPLAIGLGLFVGILMGAVTPAGAQPATSAAPTTSAGAEQTDDDDAKLRPLEPDFTLVNLPTTMPLPRHAGNFHLTHRFSENLRRAGSTFTDHLSSLFGLDAGATIQFEYRFGVLKHLEAIASRTNVDRDIQFSTKYDAFHQSASMPIGLSAIASVEGGNNFQTRYVPALGAVISRTLGTVAAVYVTPFWAHNTAAETGIDRDTGFVGLGTRLRIRPTVFLVGEVTPRVGGYGPGDAEFAFAVEKRVGAHVFSLTFANTAATTYGQIARGGFPENLLMGFNLARKFY
jgi:uncharacterized beta barrel domain-containing protein DUF5777